jgi:hypothetical protein
MALTIWHYRRTPDGRFVRLTHGDHGKFFWGHMSLEPTVPGAVHLVDLYVALECRRAVRVEHTRFDRYPADAGGQRTKAILDEARGFYERLCTLDATPQRSRARAIERRWIEQQLQWEPSEADRRALSIAVNERARRAILRPDGRALFLIS